MTFQLQNYGNDSISIDDILRKRMFALKELVSTEESYVQDLSLIVNGWVWSFKGVKTLLDIYCP